MQKTFDVQSSCYIIRPLDISFDALLGTCTYYVLYQFYFGICRYIEYISSELYEKTLHVKVFHLPFFDTVKNFQGGLLQKTCQTIMLLYCLPTPVCFSHHDVTKLLGFVRSKYPKEGIFFIKLRIYKSHFLKKFAATRQYPIRPNCGM